MLDIVINILQIMNISYISTLHKQYTVYIQHSYKFDRNAFVCFPVIPIILTPCLYRKVTVTQDYFVTLDLPKSIISGEEILLQITVFNFLPYPTTVQFY